MKVESITFLMDWKDIDDIFDYKMDVDVKLDDGHDYAVVVATPKSLLKLMENEKSDFLCPGDEPMIIVSKFTKEVVEDAIKAYANEDRFEFFIMQYFDVFDIEGPEGCWK